MSLSLATAPVIPPEVEAEIAMVRQAITAKWGAIADAEVEHANLLKADAKLVAAINDNRRVAAIPEPQAADFAELSDWHAAVRKWRDERLGLDEALAPLEADRNRMANQTVPAAAQKISGLRFDLAQLEFDAAKVENVVAQQHAKLTAERVDHFQRALWTARA